METMRGVISANEPIGGSRRSGRKRVERSTLSETDLYAPVRELFARQGFNVRGEVNGCDLAAVRDSELVVVELKTAFNTALLIQATDRQRTADSVYVALPRPEGSLRSARWKGILHLLKRLDLGLIFVRAAKTRAPSSRCAEVILEPGSPATRRHSRKRNSILRETASRTADYNVGGSVRTPLVTAYREQAVHIACCLALRGDLSPRAARALGTSDRTTSILSRNVYGWFERIARGVYRLTPEGRSAIAVFAQVAAPYLAELADLSGRQGLEDTAKFKASESPADPEA
ncbi:MAG: DUF2161 domain-containing phosphodiesterase [Bacilli bacterium]